MVIFNWHHWGILIVTLHLPVYLPNPGEMAPNGRKTNHLAGGKLKNLSR